MRVPLILIARHLCELLPSLIQTRVFGDHAFVSQYGRLSRTALTIGGRISVDQHELVTAARRLLAGQANQELKDLSGNQLTVKFDRSTVVLKVFGENDQEQQIALPDLTILSPNLDQRVHALKCLIDSFGPTAPDFSALITVAANRELTDEEIADLLEERSAGFASYKVRIEMAHTTDRIEVDDIVPDSLRYYELYCGPDPRLLPPEEYLSAVLPAYRQRLLQRNLLKGLEICLLGALRDDLMPAAWTSHVSDDEMWQTLQSINTRANPFAALGVLDIAITRQHDSRYKSLASEIMVELGKDKLVRPDGVDCYEVLHLFAQLTLDRINVLEGGALRQPFWKRLCAWMHSGLLAQSTLNISIKLDALRGWINNNRNITSTYGQMVDLRREPMYRAGGFSQAYLREEVIGRLVVLRARHQAAGRLVPNSDVIDAAMDKLAKEGSPLGWAMPGPLEGHIRPSERSNRTLSDTDTEHVLRQLYEDPSGSIWSKLAYFSQYFDLGGKVLEQACQACVPANFDLDLMKGREHPNRLFDVCLIAVSHRSKELANSIATIAVRKAPSAVTGEAAMALLQIILLASAAFENEREWTVWTSDHLDRLANILPCGEATKTFNWHLVELRKVLPMSSAATSRAEAVTAAAN